MRFCHGIAAVLLVSTALRAMAQSVPQNAINAGTISAAASDLGLNAALPGTASGEAPSFAPSGSGQPTSVVGQHFITQATPPTETYDQLIAQMPSVQDIQPNGPVAQQNYGESIRGLQYNQFNTTFDGIVVPGTTSTFAPQDAVYFTNHDIGSVSIDRGPGTASTIGYATFGGTVSILSKNPAITPDVTAYGSTGSYRSLLYGLDLNTGIQPGLDGGRGFVDVSGASSNAWLTGTTTVRRNVFLKWQQPIGQHTLVTAVAMLNSSYGHTPYGAQRSQIESFGPQYALNFNVRSQDYQGYNTDTYNTDLEYIRIESTLGDGFSVADTSYTASYYHHGSQGADPNGTTPNLNGKIYIGGTATFANNEVPGTEGHNDFRDWGNVLRLAKSAGFGNIEAGFWFDYVSNSAYKYNVDFSRGAVAYTTKKTATPFSYNYVDTLTTVQPYIQSKIDVTPWMSLIPGVRFSDITRNLDATINKSTKKPAMDAETFSAPQPSIEAKFKLAPHWTAYAQVAKGFLAPPLSVFATTAVTAVNPETTTNYQIGTAYQTGALSVGTDLYDIVFNNYIASSSVAGVTLYTNQGGAVFRGVESEATYALAKYLWIYGNGSLNDATYNNGATVAQSPRRTGALGVIYDRKSVVTADDELFASVVGKYVGPQYGSDSGKIDAYPIKSYQYVNLTGAYTLPFGTHRMRFSADIFNLANRRGIEGLAGLAGDGVTPLYWTEPGRSVVFSLSVSLNG
ncbi:MAG: TonB-dependent receptor [Acidiphilium sp.]|nr:TonB-dependent receptor [Acidiphilium sp.]MDD4935615.1 TonB-dependent receptor [Acidiphilium sp.]